MSDPVAGPIGEPVNEPVSADASLARSTAGMAAGTIASRVLGVVRATLQLAVVGALLAGDAWDVANTLPNIIYLLLAGGVLNAVLVPQITRAASHADGGRGVLRRDRLLSPLRSSVVAIIAVVFTVAAGLLVGLYSTPTWTADVRSLSTAFALICMPQIFFYGLYTLLGQVLNNARNRFAAYIGSRPREPRGHRRPGVLPAELPTQGADSPADLDDLRSPAVRHCRSRGAGPGAGRAALAIRVSWFRPRWVAVGLGTASTVAL